MVLWGGVLIFTKFYPEAIVSCKVYVGCSLTHATEEFKEGVERLKALLREVGYEVPDFLGLVAGTPADVYEVDIRQHVATCDVLLAICDFPSIGLGWEMATAVEKHRKPVLAVAQKDAHVTRLVLGVEGKHNPQFKFCRYENIEDVVQLLAKFTGRRVVQEV